MKKIILSLLFIGVFAGYIISKNSGNEHVVVPPKGLVIPQQSQTTPAQPTDAQIPTQVPVQTTPTPKPATTPKQTTPAPSGSSTPPVSKGQYKDGSYVGPVTDAYYGNVQVKAIISGGKITDVQFLQYPSDRGTSREINSQAMPYLTAEAIQAQSANVDVISGATQTSEAFIKSLGSALAQAKNS